MTTSGTSTFQMTVDDVIAESYEQLGVVPSALTGYDLKTGRRSLSLLMQEFSNRNVFACVREPMTISTVASTAQYTLEADTNDVKEMVIRVNNQDLELQRYTYAEYLRIPNKTQTGRPVYAWIDRQRDATVMTLWPVPDGVYTVTLAKLRKVEDVGAYTNTLDFPSRVLPAITAMLAYRLAMKRPKLVGDRLPLIKAEAEMQFDLATEDDRDRTTTILVPDFRSRR